MVGKIILAFTVLILVSMLIVSSYCYSKYAVCYSFIDEREAKVRCAECMSFYAEFNKTYSYEYKVLKDIEKYGCGCEHWFWDVVSNGSVYFKNCVLYCCVSKNVIAPKYYLTGEIVKCEYELPNDPICGGLEYVFYHPEAVMFTVFLFTICFIVAYIVAVKVCGYGVK